MAVDIHPLKISGCCDKGYKSYKLARHWKDIRTLHGRTGGRFIDVSTGDRYMQKVGSGGRPRSDHVSACRRRIHTEAAGMGSHPFHSHRMHKKLQVSKSGRAAENWGFQRDMAGYYLNSSVVFKFWVANQTIVMAKKKREKKTIHNRL